MQPKVWCHACGSWQPCQEMDSDNPRAVVCGNAYCGATIAEPLRPGRFVVINEAQPRWWLWRWLGV